MLFSCKCLNFIAISNDQAQYNQLHISPQTKLISNGSNEKSVDASAADLKCNIDADGDGDTESPLTSMLINTFVQKYPRNFLFYSQCMEFFKQAIGPISDLTASPITQSDLVYELTVSPVNSFKSVWKISICINCDTALCAKRISSNNAATRLSDAADENKEYYLINKILLTNNEELSQCKLDKSFSETFGILIMDNQRLSNCNGSDSIGNNLNDTIVVPSSAGGGGGVGQFLSRNEIDNNRHSKQNRVKHLTQYMQERLHKEITDTDERILRYTEQQFALLKSFREKSEQEYQILVKLVNQVPEQIPEIGGSISTIDLNRKRSNNVFGNKLNNIDSSASTTPTLSLPTNFSTSAIEPNQEQHKEQQQQQQQHQTGNVFVFNNRKITHFDTPPATPENIPMSIGNSPTFRQHQQHQEQQQLPIMSTSYQQYPTSITESSDDCFFELEGVENCLITECDVRNHEDQTHNDISDLGDSDDAEEAEDALSLDTSISIPYGQKDFRYQQQRTPSFGKSLPIAIENSSIAQRTETTNSSDDLLDDNVDIAASIKALAKSVHGEAVFGDLPRPRLRSQI